MKQQFYIQRGTDTHGPFSVDQLRQALRSKKLHPADLCSAHEGGPYLPVQELLPELFVHEASTSSTAPPGHSSSARRAGERFAALASALTTLGHGDLKSTLIGCQLLQTLVTAVIGGLFLAQGGLILAQANQLPKYYPTPSTFNDSSILHHLNTIQGRLSEQVDPIQFHQRVAWDNLALQLARMNNRGIRLVGFQLTLSDPVTKRRVYDCVWEVSDRAKNPRWAKEFLESEIESEKGLVEKTEKALRDAGL